MVCIKAGGWMQQLWAIFFMLLLSSFSAWAQTCGNAIPLSSPDSRYIDGGNGTVIDLHTGLMWQQCAVGLSGADCTEGAVETFRWDKALQYSDNINATSGFANYFNWHLPNIKELLSLVEDACIDPAVNLNYFPNTTSANFWTSTPYMGLPGAFFYIPPPETWYVNFSGGYSGSINRDTDGLSVRLVRFIE